MGPRQTRKTVQTHRGRERPQNAACRCLRGVIGGRLHPEEAAYVTMEVALNSKVPTCGVRSPRFGRDRLGYAELMCGSCDCFGYNLLKCCGAYSRQRGVDVIAFD